MKLPLLNLTSILTVGFSFAASLVFSASPPALPKTKQEAEAKGYIFFASHDAIMAGAKKEGKLRVSSGLEMSNFKPWMNAFKQRYPFITDIHVEEVVGSEGHQRFILEIKSGQAKGWDVIHVNIDFSSEYIPVL